MLERPRLLAARSAFALLPPAPPKGLRHCYLMADCSLRGWLRDVTLAPRRDEMPPTMWGETPGRLRRILDRRHDSDWAA